MADSNRKILAASFSTPDGGTRGAASVGGGFPDKVGNTAVLLVRADGGVKFIESKDWGAGRGALLGGAIGIIGGPIGILAGGSIGALTSKLRDSGFKNDQLEALGKSMQPNSSAAVIEISEDAVPQAEQILKVLGCHADRHRGHRLERRRALRGRVRAGAGHGDRLGGAGQPVAGRRRAPNGVRPRLVRSEALSSPQPALGR